MSLKSTMEVKPPKDEQIHPQEKATPYPIPHPSLLQEHQIHHQNEEDSYLNTSPELEPEPEHTHESIVYNNDTIINNNNNANNNVNNNVNDLLLEDISKEDEAYLNSFPSGYRFSPHDDELIVDYLKKKVLNQPLPTNKIRSVDLYRYNPKMLIERLSENRSGEVENEWYFFTPRSRKYRNGTRPNRAAGGGFWKATGADKPVRHEGTLVGFRKALVFYEGKPPQGEKTSWIMHEYRVDEPPRNKSNADDMRLDDWVLCKLHKKPDRFVKIAREEEEPPLVVNPNPLDQVPLHQVPLPYHENNFEQCGHVVNPMEPFNSYDPINDMFTTEQVFEAFVSANCPIPLPLHYGSQRLSTYDISPQPDTLQSFEYFNGSLDGYAKRLKPSSPLKASSMFNPETVTQNVLKPQSKSQ